MAKVDQGLISFKDKARGLSEGPQGGWGRVGLLMAVEGGMMVDGHAGKDMVEANQEKGKRVGQQKTRVK